MRYPKRVKFPPGYIGTTEYAKRHGIPYHVVMGCIHDGRLEAVRISGKYFCMKSDAEIEKIETGRTEWTKVG